jgi:hypothetical protein
MNDFAGSLVSTRGLSSSDTTTTWCGQSRCCLVAAS